MEWFEEEVMMEVLKFALYAIEAASVFWQRVAGEFFRTGVTSRALGRRFLISP